MKIFNVEKMKSQLLKELTILALRYSLILSVFQSVNPLMFSQSANLRISDQRTFLMEYPPLPLSYISIQLRLIIYLSLRIIMLIRYHLYIVIVQYTTVGTQFICIYLYGFFRIHIYIYMRMPLSWYISHNSPLRIRITALAQRITTTNNPESQYFYNCWFFCFSGWVVCVYTYLLVTEVRRCDR